jgi:hypothetical protein
MPNLKLLRRYLIVSFNQVANAQSVNSNTILTMEHVALFKSNAAISTTTLTSAKVATAAII